MSAISPTTATDRECLEAWQRRPGAESLRPLVERYVAFVYSTAYRRTGNSQQAEEVTRAVFLVLARRARRLRKKTVLAGWLFHVTAVACRKLAGKPRRAGLRRWFGRTPKSEMPDGAPLWVRVAPEIDSALERLSSALRDALLLRFMLNQDWALVASVLRKSERRVKKRVERGLKKLIRLLRKRGVVTDAETLAQICSVEGCAASMPEGLAAEIVVSIAPLNRDASPSPALRAPSPPVGERDGVRGTRGDSSVEDAATSSQESSPSPAFEAPLDTVGSRASIKLARQTLNTLTWARWRKRFAIGIPCFILLLVTAAVTAWQIDARTGHSRLISMFFVWSVKREGRTVPGMAQPARPWPVDASSPRQSATTVRTAHDLYQATNVWLAHLKFTREQWDAVQPKRIDPLPHFFQPDGTVLLRHPEAQRSGLAGVLGFDFHWTHADFELGGVAFTNAAARIKGNGTYLGSLYGDKCAFKVDLNKFTKGQKLAGADELTFNNLVNDHSFLSDTLAYEFFRDAGVPASRTAYAYLSASVEDKWERKPLGLYVMVEAVDEDFAFERFGSKKAPVFKPVTYELFKHLGDDWAAYEAIYDLKTKATPEQLQRVIEFARLLTHADDEEFAKRAGEFLDLERFARYLACEVLLSNYDGFLSNGQNFYLYLHPGSNKFGFIPWDLDLSWGGFFLLGTKRERERASIWHPWVGQHRLLERVMAVEEFRQLYRSQLEDLLARLFIPGRLHPRIDAVAQVIRSPIAAESDFRLRKFEQAVSGQRVERSSGDEAQGANRPAHQIKRFIEARAKSVREQLDGKSDGVVLERARRK